MFTRRKQQGEKETGTGDQLTSEEMTLKVLRVQIGLVTVRTGELSIRILCRNGGVLGSTVDTIANRRPTRDAREDASPSLRPDNLSAWRLLSIGSGSICSRHVRARPNGGLAIGIAERTGRHRGKVRSTVTRRCGRNGLRVALGAGRWGQQMGGVVLLRLLRRRVLGRMREERRWRQAAHRGVRWHGRRGRRVHFMSGRCGIARHVRAIRLAHVVRRRRLTVMRLQRRQSVCLRHRILRLHLVLRHWHTRQRSRTLREGSRRRPRRVRSGIHRGDREESAEIVSNQVMFTLPRSLIVGSFSLRPFFSSSSFFSLSFLFFFRP